MTYETKVAILGAGVTGMCAAHYLSELLGRESVLVLEAAQSPGGTTRTECIDGFRLDWGPNGFLDREPLTLKWVDDLGLTDSLVRANEAAAKRFILKNGNLVEIKPPPAFMFSPLLSVAGRMRLLCEPFVPQKSNDNPETIWNFAARRIGHEAADTLVSCMVSGVFGGDAKQLSLEHCFPRMAAMEKEYGTLFKALMSKRRANKKTSAMGPSGVLTTFSEGIGFLPAHVAEQLDPRVLFGNGARRITRENKEYRVETSNGDTVNAQYVIVAMPTYAAADALADFDADVAKVLAQIPYADIAVICTGYSREQIAHDVNGFGFLVPRSEGKRMLGCLWTSSIFPHEAPDGSVLLRTMIGGATDPDAVRLSDAQLLDIVHREVHPLMRVNGAPKFTRIFRHVRGIPQYLLNHGQNLEAIAAAEQRNPGLYFAGNAYRGVGLNDCVVSAVRAVERLAADDK
ncbi:MAG: protoporphyrinogen oxidase [Candidatus Hydrogenedentes bacterium]|nr:protoporphyrinogen oxidase [Candidatus Hydrogenedentota bacterium]